MNNLNNKKMDKNKIKLVVASEMIIISHETKGKKPSDLTFEEMVDVVTDIVVKLQITNNK